MRYGNLHILAVMLGSVALHLLNKVFISEEHLPLELLPRRRRLDAFGHEQGVTRD